MNPLMYDVQNHEPFLKDLVEGGCATLTREVGDFILTSTQGSRVELISLLVDDLAWGVLESAETWSVSYRLQWLFTAGVDQSALSTNFFCELYKAA